MIECPQSCLLEAIGTLGEPGLTKQSIILTKNLGLCWLEVISSVCVPRALISSAFLRSLFMPQTLSVIQDTNDCLDLDIRFSGATLSNSIVQLSLKHVTKSLVFEHS